MQLYPAPDDALAPPPDRAAQTKRPRGRPPKTVDERDDGNRRQALLSAATLMRAGAHMVKLEGGGWTVPVVHHLVERGIPVCAHLGLTPQSVHALGGYRVQGRSDEAAATLRQPAQR